MWREIEHVILYFEDAFNMTSREEVMDLWKDNTKDLNLPEDIVTTFRSYIQREDYPKDPTSISRIVERMIRLEDRFTSQ